ncbi:MAG: hypothetical protein WD793_10850 [Steroidobacteraceae bacterium]
MPRKRNSRWARRVVRSFRAQLARPTPKGAPRVSDAARTASIFRVFRELERRR